MQDEITSVSPGEEMTVKINTGTKRLIQLRHGVVGWNKNFVDDDGNQAPFAEPGPDGLCAYENLDRFDDELFQELPDAIEEGNSISEEDSKNLPSAHGSEGKE